MLQISRDACKPLGASYSGRGWFEKVCITATYQRTLSQEAASCSEPYDIHSAPTGEPMEDERSYLRWLEEMWDIQKFDVHGSTEREEERTEEVLEVFRDLARLSRRHVKLPDLPPWELLR